jgi:N-acetylglutamate synthase-like GNAT family acetyltransferase
VPRASLTVRTATPAQARRLFALISAHVDSGHLLPRSFEDIQARIPRFVVAMRGRRLAGCAELAALGPHVAEVRSLVVASGERGEGVGQTLVAELTRRARAEAFDKLCAFTHAPDFFARMGFSIVPHLWLPEKVVADCVACTYFRRCGQTAMEVALDDPHEGLGEGRALPLAARTA